MTIFDIQSDGTITSDKIFIAWCGCGGTAGTITKALTIANIPIDRYPQLKTTANTALNKYLQQEGYTDLFPSLRKTTHAVMINAKTGIGVDLYGWHNKITEEEKEALKQGVLDVIKG